MRMSKSKAFWCSYFGILATYFVTLFIAHDVALAIAPTVIGALTVSGGLYQAANVADNGVKGKYYRADLDTKKES